MRHIRVLICRVTILTPTRSRNLPRSISRPPLVPRSRQQPPWTPWKPPPALPATLASAAGSTPTGTHLLPN